MIDLVSRSVVQRLGNSENGSIAFTPDRTRAYVCEPGSQRDIVTVYNLAANPISVAATLPTSGGVRYRPEISRDGTRMYVPVHDGIDVFDVLPSSPTYHQRLGKFPTPITGNRNTIFTGPLDCAISPDGTTLLIAYGQNLAWPAPSAVGAVDQVSPGNPYRSIPVTTGGDFLGMATRQSIAFSPDGALAFTVEYAVQPGFPFSRGFAQGGLLNVIDVASGSEIMAIPTQGISQQNLAVDRLGRNLWIAQAGYLSGQAELLRVDIDRRSSTRFSITARIILDQVPFSVNTGAVGVSPSPDGNTVCVTLAEDNAHPTPVLVTVDARTNQVVGSPIMVESLPGTVSVPQW
ncbi:MAG: hypothetical protein Fur0037_09640 [Planctomycetota bacterium]